MLKARIPRIILLLLVLLCGTSSFSLAQKRVTSVVSPDKKLEASIYLDGEGRVFYSLRFKGTEVLQASRLGMVRSDGDFSRGLKLTSIGSLQQVSDQYRLFSGKRQNCTYVASRKEINFRNAKGQPIDMIFQVSDDGLAFRYFCPGSTTAINTVTEENTSFHFPLGTKAWLQPMQEAKSGWESTNPAYEEHYELEIEVGRPAPTKAGWVFPALFHYKDAWILLSESWLDTVYCGTRLKPESPDGEYSIGFPDPKEGIKDGNVLPRSRLPFYSPWRIIAIGDLKTIAESTLGTDLAKPSAQKDLSFIKPGKASWSWIMSKDDSIVYSEQLRYIDFAAGMHWQYCLVDAAWDKKIGYDKIKELSRYAAKKKVGLLLWYNSAGNWNTVKYTPKDKLLTHADRVHEFTLLKQMGIKGVKIDFFGGDGQSVIKYYTEILEDAASFGLMVNFHGATLPRGWQRTYPNLLTTEAVRGFEMVTFNQKDADSEAVHCTMLPFARNVFDPMDFTPVNLYKIPTRVNRKTSSAFELALSVVFLSGIQHFAESPQGMAHVPDFVQDFLRVLPSSWDEIRFIDGYPGKYIVLARRSGNHWYLAGINAEEQEKKIELDLSSFQKQKGLLITDGEEPLSFSKEAWSSPVNSRQITLKPGGGFVLLLE